MDPYKFFSAVFLAIALIAGYISRAFGVDVQISLFIIFLTFFCSEIITASLLGLYIIWLFTIGPLKDFDKDPHW